MYQVGVRPSFSTGFAQWPGMSEYPQLWTGLLGAWDMTLGQTGTKLFDWSGKGNHGVFVNTPTWVSSPIGPCVLMNDANDRYIAVPHNSNLNPSGDLTVVVSFASTDTAQYAGIIGKYVANDEYVINFGSSPGAIRYAVDGTTFQTTTTWNDGQIHQAVITRKGVVGTIYVDGKVEASNGAVNANPITNTVDLWIGGWTAGTGYILDGTIHYAMVYNRALSASEQLLHYQLRKRMA